MELPREAGGPGGGDIFRLSCAPFTNTLPYGSARACSEGTHSLAHPCVQAGMGTAQAAGGNQRRYRTQTPVGRGWGGDGGRFTGAERLRGGENSQAESWGRS